MEGLTRDFAIVAMTGRLRMLVGKSLGVLSPEAMDDAPSVNILGIWPRPAPTWMEQWAEVAAAGVMHHGLAKQSHVGGAKRDELRVEMLYDGIVRLMADWYLRGCLALQCVLHWVRGPRWWTVRVVGVHLNVQRRAH